jgi:hypothetical protein
MRTIAACTAVVVLLMTALAIGCGGNNEVQPISGSIKLIKTDGTEVGTSETPIPLGTKVQITFDEALSSEDRGEFETLFTLSDPDGSSVSGEFAWNADFTSVTFSPSGRLSYATEYTAEISDPASSSLSTNKAIASETASFKTMTEGDTDGDGYADLVVGAFGMDVGGNSDAGAAYLFKGSASGIETTSAVKWEGEAADERLGLNWDTADLNGDGYADVIIGVPNRNSDKGTVLIFDGSSTGVPSTPSTTISGFSDGERFGFAVSKGGDINADGFDDLIVGAPTYDITGLENVGATYVFLGSADSVPTSPSNTVSGQYDNGTLGACVSSAGDVNGDGFDDVITTSIGVDNRRGAAFIYEGSASGMSTVASTVLAGSAEDDVFGAFCTSAGDIDNDGFSDILIGAIGYEDYSGGVFVYYGSDTGIPSTADQVFQGTPLEHDETALIARVGDLNDDGFDDVAIGSYFVNGFDGVLNIHNGSASGASPTADDTLSGAVGSGEYFGVVLPSRDINGDGYPDLIVASPGYDSFTGRVYIFYGSASGPDKASPDLVYGEAQGGFFGMHFQS